MFKIPICSTASVQLVNKCSKNDWLFLPQVCEAGSGPARRDFLFPVYEKCVFFPSILTVTWNTGFFFLHLYFTVCDVLRFLDHKTSVSRFYFTPGSFDILQSNAANFYSPPRVTNFPIFLPAKMTTSRMTDVALAPHDPMCVMSDDRILHISKVR